MIDQYVETLAVARMSAPDARELVRPPASGPDLGVLKGRRSDLRAQADEVVLLTGRAGRSGQMAAQRLDELEAEEAEVERQIQAAMAIDPLAAVVEADDVEAAWNRLHLRRKRAIIDALMTVSIRRVGPGGRCRNFREAATSIDISWKTPHWSHSIQDEHVEAMGDLPDVVYLPGDVEVPVVGRGQSAVIREAFVRTLVA